MVKIFKLFLLCSLFVTSAYAQTVVEFKFDDTTGNTITKESLSNTDFTLKNNFNRPERIAGVSGNALRLDGWSTWAESTSFVPPSVGNQFSIETWYATEAFPAENASIIHQDDNQKGFSLQVGSFGSLTFVFWVESFSKVVTSSIALEKYKWNHIAATADLVAGVSKLYINGVEAASVNIGTSTLPFAFANTTMYLGRRNILKTFAGFSLNTLNGALDELKIHKTALTPQQIQTNYNQYKNIIPDLNINPDIRHAGDRLRPQYHAMPNTSWTNEPYGLIYFKGKYHLFFQKNPNGPYLYFMHWGHLTSTDLVNWQEEKIALAPSQGFSSFGKWSGTTIKDETGKPVIVFTGVNGAKAGIGVAFANSDTLDKWTEYIGNPVVSAPPSAYQHMDFRDPYVWKEGAIYYMIVGSGLQNNGGGILFMYKSNDLKTWLSVQPLYQNSNTSLSGTFWEMPFFYKINDTDYVLQVLPIPTSSARARSLYWIGKFENDKFIPYFTQPKPLEYINEKMLAPAIGTDETRQPAYIGIIPDDRDVNDQIKAGWRHTFSLPRVLRLLKDSTLGQIPHPNLCRLRTNPVQVKNRKIVSGNSFNIPEVEGVQTELEFKVKAAENSKFLIQVFKNTDLTELTSIGFDLKRNEISLDRQLSTLSNASKTKETVPYILNFKDTMTAKLFLDRSVLEIFIDNVIIFSARVYPSKASSNKIDLVVPEGSAEIIELNAWQMKPMRQVTTTEVCPIPAKDLPQRLRTLSDVTAIIEKKTTEKGFSLTPSVSSDFLRLNSESTDFPNNTIVSIYSIDGRLMNSLKVHENTNLTIADLKAGTYIVFIKTDSFFQSFKIIKQ